MSDENPESSPEHSPPALTPPPVQAGPDQQELFPAAAFLQIERQRIDSYNRRSEVASQAVAASNEANKRQFEYQMAKLAAEESASKRKDVLARIVVIGLGIFGVILASLFLIMAFFGNAAQSTIALQILKVLGVGGGGYGIISGLASLIRRLTHNK